jgi:hypothetical protein
MIWLNHVAFDPGFAPSGNSPAWMSVGDLMRATNADKADLLAMLQPLGGSVVTLKVNGNQQAWDLQFPSLFLLPRAAEYKRYLVPGS